MDIRRNGSQPSEKGPAEWFTGTVRLDPLFRAPDPARVAGANVTFEPGARTHWHTHPLGQTLVVTAGSGLVQRWAGPIEDIRPGDVIWIPPGEKHWHGASATTAMTHIAIQERLDGKAVDWLEHVSDEQYTAVGIVMFSVGMWQDLFWVMLVGALLAAPVAWAYAVLLVVYVPILGL